MLQGDVMWMQTPCEIGYYRAELPLFDEDVTIKGVAGHKVKACQQIVDFARKVGILGEIVFYDVENDVGVRYPEGSTMTEDSHG